MEETGEVFDSPSRSASEDLYYVTALSNLARAYDKYGRVYDKARISESSFPQRFFLLRPAELGIGMDKAAHLPAKTGLAGDRLIALETRVCTSELHPNNGTGLGRFVERGHIDVRAVHLADPPQTLTPLSVEEACARSLRLHLGSTPSFDRLAPRSVSLLPVAIACTASCAFCFSKASVSAHQPTGTLARSRVVEVLRAGRARGATRAVITGGGEPSLLPEGELERLITEARAVFPKVVLISNGHKWGRMSDERRAEALAGLAASGLSVLALSRHHFDPAVNATLMGLDTATDNVARTWADRRAALGELRLRWICVLQRGAVADRASLEQYLDWAAASGVDEVCFKELYVSTSVESEYHDRLANEWSADHQVPLRLVLDLARDADWSVHDRLPWGAPVFAGRWRGRPIRVAAYTEPSLFWELANGVCRSWNLMADGRCLASLEDRSSEVLRDGLRELPPAS